MSNSFQVNEGRPWGKTLYIIAVLLRNREYRFLPFWSQAGYGFCTIALNWVCVLEATFASLAIGG